MGDGVVKVQDGNSTRERLEQVAARLFQEKGFDGTSIRELAKELGMESASLYYYFSSKEELLYAISREALEEVIAAVQPLAEGNLSGDEACKALIDTHISLMLENRNKHAVMLLELRSLPTRRHKSVVVLRDRYESLVLEVLERAQSDGFLTKDIPAQVLKLLLLNLMNWSIFWYKPDGPLTSSQIAEWVTTLFLDGARPAARKKR